VASIIEEKDKFIEEKKVLEMKKTIDDNKAVISNLQNKVKIQSEEVVALKKEIAEVTTQRDFFKREGERYQRISQDMESAIGMKLDAGIIKTMEMESKPLIQIKDEQIKSLNKEIESLKVFVLCSSMCWCCRIN
jgi:hypothetical protein